MVLAVADPTYAFGVLLRLTSTREGGRRIPLAGGWDREHRFNYRPNWGLPGMEPPDQTGAPVLGFDQEQIAPGDSARAVIVAFFPGMVPTWALVTPGERLAMYEGRDSHPGACARRR